MINAGVSFPQKNGFQPTHGCYQSCTYAWFIQDGNMGDFYYPHPKYTLQGAVFGNKLVKLLFCM